MTEKIVLGIDIGGTNIVFGLVNKKGDILAKESIPTSNFPLSETLVAVVSERTRNLILSLKNPFELIGIGIGAPNGNFFTGCIEFPPNLKWKGIIPLAKYFSESLQCKTILINDAKAAALGEL